jgi:hypothetical protein
MLSFDASIIISPLQGFIRKIKIYQFKEPIIMKRFFILFLFTAFVLSGFAQFSVSANKRFLLKNAKPFFWLGDTGWELFHRLDGQKQTGT